MDKVIVCVPKRLPKEKIMEAAARAVKINPMNYSPLHRLAAVSPELKITKEALAVVTQKYWQSKKVHLTVAFMDGPSAALKKKILVQMNAWSKTADVNFSESNTDPMVRISREFEGYWSYVGTDILLIRDSEPTMNLEGFTENTSDSEFVRVVRHETGHTMGFPHEHMRKELVDKIDKAKAYRYFWETQGWEEKEVDTQVLTPLEELSLWGTDHADSKSIMCYQIPGTITVDGKPILGGDDIDAVDYEFAAKCYPKQDS